MVLQLRTMAKVKVWMIEVLRTMLLMTTRRSSKSSVAETSTFAVEIL
jgi:hypothetical protein